MATKYYAVLTNVGAAKLANATALGAQVEITQMAVGDGNGVLPTPNPAQTALVHELRRKPLNSLSIDPNNANQIIAEQVIPEDEGGWWIREIGLFDKDGDMIAVANCAETYKPQLQEGSGRVQVVRMILIVSSTAAVTLKIDPAVVLATRKYVDDKALELKVYADDQMAKHLAAPDPHSQYAPKASPTFTGTPKAPTPAAGNNTTQVATTAFVQAALTALINGAPATLDTLKEIAAAINNDPNFATTMLNALAGKQPLDNTLTNLSGKDVAGLLTYLGLQNPDGSVGRLIGVRVFTISGIYNSSAGTKSVIVDATGGGAGSGGVPATSSSQSGISAAGSSGSFARARYSSNFSGLQIQIGAGGVAGTSTTSGGDGGVTTFGSLLSCPGGKGSIAGIVSATQAVAVAPVQSLSPTGSNIIRASSGAPVNNAIQTAFGTASGWNPSAAGDGMFSDGLGGSGVYQGASKSAVNGNAGTRGIVVVWEYA